MAFSWPSPSSRPTRSRPTPDGDNKVSREEAVEYFGKSKTAKAFIWVLWAFRLVEDVGGAEG